MSSNVIRVLFLADIGEKGGASKQLLDLVLNLKKYNDIEIIVVNAKSNAINNILSINGIKNFSINYYPFIIPSETGIIRLIIKFIPRLLQYYLFRKAAVKKLESIVVSNKINLIHSYINRVDIGARVANRYNIQHIWHIHEFGELDYKCVSLVPNYIQYMNRFDTAFIAISDSVKEYWLKKGINREIETIYNGVCVKSSNTYIEHDFRFLNVIMVGTICETKGQYQLVEAVNLLPLEYLRLMHFTIVGPGVKSYINNLKNKIRKYNLEESFTFLEYNDNIVDELDKYNVGITASRSEGFGRVTVEYMAKRILPIVSNTGANTELVKKYDNGLVFEYGNYLDFAHQLMYVIENPKQCNKLVNKAYESYNRMFTIERYVENVHEYYRKKL